MLSLIIQLFGSKVQLAHLSVVCMKLRGTLGPDHQTCFPCFQKLSMNHTPPCAKSYMKTSDGEQELLPAGDTYLT